MSGLGPRTPEWVRRRSLSRNHWAKAPPQGNAGIRPAAALWVVLGKAAPAGPARPLSR